MFYLNNFYSKFLFFFKAVLDLCGSRQPGDKETRGDLPDGPVVKNPPSNAGDAGSNPGPGAKIPHATTKIQHSFKKK